MTTFRSWPKWVLDYYARIKENSGVCDIPQSVCHRVDSLKDSRVKGAWVKKRRDWLDKWELKR
jgi:hypothetical protein